MSELEQEKKNKRIAFFSTIGIQAVLFVLLFVLVAYRPPNPPLSDLGSGIELNIGFDDEGGGDDPMDTPVGNDGDQKEESQNQPQEAQKEEVKEVVKEETKPVDTKTEDDLISSDEESSVTVKPKKEEVKPVEKPKEKVEEKKPEVKPQAVFNPTEKKTESDTKATGTKEGKPGSEGDDEGKTGNKGKPEGTLVKGGQYTGTPGSGGGGGGGSSLDLSGWAWDQKPNPAIADNESGRLVFEIKVDDNGDIISIKKLEGSVSQETEQICRKSIEKLTFIQTGTSVPAISIGKITFVIRSK